MSDLVQETAEGEQEIRPRSATEVAERLREQGAVLRVPHLPDDVDSALTDDETMIINMGPQHPSTHGVLRLMLELDGETVLRTKPVIGYLHTGMEKTGEELTYLQGGTNVTRMDYLSPLHNELVFALATEKLLDIEVPPRATWIRMLMTELNRMSSHFTFLATNDATLITDPPPDATSAGMPCRQHSHTPFRLTAMTRSHTSSGVSAVPPSSGGRMPALL